MLIAPNHSTTNKQHKPRFALEAETFPFRHPLPLPFGLAQHLLQYPAAGHQTGTVTGYGNHLHRRIHRLYLHGQITAVHVGHDHVRHQHIHDNLRFSSQLDRLAR